MFVSYVGHQVYVLDPQSVDHGSDEEPLRKLHWATHHRCCEPSEAGWQTMTPAAICFNGCMSLDFNSTDHTVDENTFFYGPHHQQLGGEEK